MKKYVYFLVIVPVLFCWFLSVNAAFADVIVESDNLFYKRHSDECVFLGRLFAANGAEGFVAVMEAPDSGKEAGKIENGETVWLQFSCLYDGDFWGLSERFSGWVRIDQLLVLYDYVAFAEEHQDEFYPYRGGYDEIVKAGSAVLWAWPGADEPLWIVEDIDNMVFTIGQAYRDGEGREWGFIVYAHGYSDEWICISDPANRDIPAFNPAPAPAVWVSDTEHVDIYKHGGKPGLGGKMLTVIIVLVAAVVVVTVVLIKRFWKPNKNRETDTN